MIKNYDYYSSQKECIHFAYLAVRLEELKKSSELGSYELFKNVDGKFFLLDSRKNVIEHAKLLLEGYDGFFNFELLDTMIQQNRVRSTYNLYKIKVKRVGL